MELNDKIFHNSLEVGKITFISKEAIFVTFYGEDKPVRFHNMLIGGFLKTMTMLAQFDKLTDFYHSA